MEGRKLNICTIVLAVIGIILVVIGGVLIPVLNNKIKETVEQNVRLINNTEAFNEWKDPSAPIYISFYFFNVSNAEDVVKNGSKPKLEEFGPITYREYRNKTDIKFADNETKIHYEEHKYYVFDSDTSQYNDSLVICTINIPILALATEVQFYPSLIQDAISVVISALGEGLFQCHTVKELLWGYTPKAINEINKILEEFGFQKRFNFTFGLYSGPTGNGTADGEVDIYTGVGDIKKLGIVEKWKGNSTLPFWHGSCNEINGSDGTLWHPFVEKSETLFIFNTDLCRSLYISYTSTKEISASKIPTYSFSPPKSVMADPRTNEDNLCFCSPYDANGTFCLGGGVFNVSNCRQDAPIIMSEPHFYEAPDYVNDVIGMKPDPEKHQTFLDIEPTTGLVLNAHKRIQVNLYVKKLSSFKETENLKNPIIFPVVWGDEHAIIPDDKASEFYRTVLLPMKIAAGVTYGLIALGALLLLIALVLLIVILVKRQNAGDKETNAAAVDDDDEPLLSG